jgi:hypothetical protein
MQLTYKSHYNPCFWTAHWNSKFLDAALNGKASYDVARDQTVYALNVKSNKLYETTVANVHYDKGVGVAEITAEAAKDFCKRRQPEMYEEYCRWTEEHPETVYLDVEAVLTGIEKTQAYSTLKRVLGKGRIDGKLEKGLIAGFIAVHNARSHAVLNSMMELHSQTGIHRFESIWMLKRYLSNTEVLHRHVMTYALGYFTLYKMGKDTFPLNDSPILIKPKSIMVALSPRLLLEIDQTRNRIPHDCCVSNHISSEKLEEFRIRTIANTFREIIFGSRELLEEWQNTKEFAERHALISNVKSYNAVVAQYQGGDIWRLNAYADRDPSEPPLTAIASCKLLLYPGVSQEAIARNVVKVDTLVEGGRPATMVPLFTDSNFAEAFISAAGEAATGMTILAIDALDELACVLAELEQMGATHVHFNAMPVGHPSPVPVRMKDVIGSLTSARAYAF